MPTGIEAGLIFRGRNPLRRIGAEVELGTDRALLGGVSAQQDCSRVPGIFTLGRGPVVQRLSRIGTTQFSQGIRPCLSGQTICRAASTAP